MPAYEISDVTPGIVHVGLGAFHRAHQAVYLDDLLGEDPSWGIVGASLRSSETIDRLRSQDHLYFLEVKHCDNPEYRAIGSIISTASAKSGSSEIIESMVSPDTRIVTLTITESGYCIDPHLNTLDRSLPDIEHDLRNPTQPKTAPAIIARALNERRKNGLQPFSVLSCDNLSANGSVLRQAVIEMAECWDQKLASWIDDHATFPASMVDRITPATTTSDLARIGLATGLEDSCPVTSEPFSQWVIEDSFCAGRPRFESAGVGLVSDVSAYEEMKLKMLNGSHSALAYLGSLAGHRFVSQAISDPWLGRFVRKMWELEVIPQLAGHGSMEPFKYGEDLIERFSNTAIAHELSQIARDGSKKLPIRIIPSLEHNLQNGKKLDHLVTVLVAWVLYLEGMQKSGLLDSFVDVAFKKIGNALGQADGPNAVCAVLEETGVTSRYLLNDAGLKNLIFEIHNDLRDRFGRVVV